MADKPFFVLLQRSGKKFLVPEDQTLLQVLEANGIDVSSSCRAGTCSSCLVRVIEGEVDHRDFVLDDDERQDLMTICVSRAASDLLVLDL